LSETSYSKLRKERDALALALEATLIRIDELNAELERTRVGKAAGGASSVQKALGSLLAGGIPNSFGSPPPPHVPGTN
jgi:hypothetical protein